MDILQCWLCGKAKRTLSSEATFQVRATVLASFEKKENPPVNWRVFCFCMVMPLAGQDYSLFAGVDYSVHRIWIWRRSPRVIGISEKLDQKRGRCPITTGTLNYQSELNQDIAMEVKSRSRQRPSTKGVSLFRDNLDEVGSCPTKTRIQATLSQTKKPAGGKPAGYWKS